MLSAIRLLGEVFQRGEEPYWPIPVTNGQRHPVIGKSISWCRACASPWCLSMLGLGFSPASVGKSGLGDWWELSATPSSAAAIQGASAHLCTQQETYSLGVVVTLPSLC